jgi:hypothetical protein
MHVKLPLKLDLLGPILVLSLIYVDFLWLIAVELVAAGNVAKAFRDAQ